jgi:hypothetical protein
MTFHPDVYSMLPNRMSALPLYYHNHTKYLSSIHSVSDMVGIGRERISKDKKNCGFYPFLKSTS